MKASDGRRCMGRRGTLMLGLWLGLLCVPALAAERWISTGGALSEWVTVLGGEARLVAVDSTSRHPAQLTRLPNVGYQRQLSAEGLLALRPDRVLITEEAGPPVVVAQLQRAGVSVERFSSAPDLSALAETVQRLGRLLQREEEAARVWRAFQQDLQRQARRLRQLREQRPPPRVLLLVSHAGGQPLAAGRDTVGDWLVRQAGGHNVARHQGHKTMSQELLLALRPTVILVADRRLQGTAAVQALVRTQPAWRQLDAVRAGQVHAIDTTWLVGGLGPRLPAALDQLTARFYGSQRHPVVAGRP